MGRSDDDEREIHYPGAVVTEMGDTRNILHSLMGMVTASNDNNDMVNIPAQSVFLRDSTHLPPTFSTPEIE